MTRTSLKNLLSLAMAGMLFSGCHSDVDLSNVTVDSKAQIKLSMPIGEISTKFADMMGLITEDANVVINDKGIIELRLKQHYENEFHAIELTDYVGTVESDVTIQSVNPALVLLPADTEVDVPFDMNVLFSGVNDDTSEERLDSMVIDLARFTTKISKSADLMITDNDIKKVELQLGSMFRRAKGTVIELPNFRLDTDIPIEIDHFTLNMMKDETQAPSSSNVVNTANIRFVITLKTGDNVVISPVSGFHFSFKVEMMSYSALYGYFEPGNETHDQNSIDVPITIGDGEPAILPVKEPEIRMKFTYALAMPLDVNIGYIKAIHSDDTETFANWSGTTSPRLHLYSFIPIDSPLGTYATDSSIILNESSTNGQIDRFFEKEVKKLGYDYKLSVDKQREMNGKVLNQYRMTQDTKFAFDFEFNMPFDFKAGLNVSFGDTIKDVSLERASLDSLAALSNGLISEIESAELCLYLTIKNNIPVTMSLDAIFLDENNAPLKLDQLKDIKIEGATMSGSNIIPAEGVQAVAVHTDEFDELAKTRSIRFRAKVGDKQNPSTFLADQALSIKMGVTADIQALISLGAIKK